MVNLYAANIKSLPDPKEDSQLLHLLSDERRQKTLNFIQADDRRRSLGAGLLINHVLPLFGASPRNVIAGADGKPKAEGVCFNLSHSGDWVICAAGEKAVGCDVEKITEAPKKVAEHFFHQNELIYLKQCEPQLYDETFFRLWTMKESYMKMTGEGMSLALDQFELVFVRDKIQVRRDGKALSCQMKEYNIPDYKVTVCAEENKFSAHIKFIEF